MYAQEVVLELSRCLVEGNLVRRAINPLHLVNGPVLGIHLLNRIVSFAALLEGLPTVHLQFELQPRHLLFVLEACDLSLLFVFEVLPFVQKLRQSSLN